MQFFECPAQVEELVRTWVDRLDLTNEPLQVTTSRARFEQLLGRKVNARIGGAYIFLPGPKIHAVLINLPRINTSQPRAIEIVVCEELLHMRHRLDGDLRGHAKHGYDRIAHQVAELTGASLEEIRAALLPVERKHYKYRYECPTCKRSVFRRKRGVWSCGACSPRFSKKHVLQLVEVLERPEPVKQQAMF